MPGLLIRSPESAFLIRKEPCEMRWRELLLSGRRASPTSEVLQASGTGRASHPISTCFLVRLLKMHLVRHFIPWPKRQDTLMFFVCFQALNLGTCVFVRFNLLGKELSRTNDNRKNTGKERLEKPSTLSSSCAI